MKNSGREAAEARMDVQGKDKRKTSKQASKNPLEPQIAYREKVSYGEKD